jgi:Hg(II)-responsive transcriptional regulator
VPDRGFTIGRLARAADVGVETVRYYQQRKLLPVPASQGSFRRYDEGLVQRIRFIKRAQELGFALEEIRELLRLNDGTDRRAIRRISSARLDQIEDKLTDLNRMRKVLKHLIAECENAGTSRPCPIIETLSSDP